MVDNYKEVIRDIIDYAEKENIPIMQKEGIYYLTSYIDKHDITNILEIGTAIGFSAIMMSMVRDDIKVTSIEKDEKRYLEAVKNVKRMGLEDRITLIFNDALKVNLDDKYDLIFIDAAKSKNRDIFEKFQSLLNPDGVIVTDNMNFHGLINKTEDEIKSKNLRSLVKKVKEYHEFLKTNKKYDTEIINVGDGVAFSKRKTVGDKYV